MADCSVVHVPYLYCDPLISGKEVEFAALKHRGNQAMRDFSYDYRITVLCWMAKRCETHFLSLKEVEFLSKCASCDQPYPWQQPHRKPHSPPAGLHWGFLRTLHTRPAWVSTWWTWIWRLGHQTSPAAGRRKLPRLVKEKATLCKASPHCLNQRIGCHVLPFVCEHHCKIGKLCNTGWRKRCQVLPCQKAG